MRALNSRPGMASIRTVASWFALSRPRSDFVETRLEVDRGEIGQLENRRARPRAVAFAELLLAAEHAAERKFGRMLTMPARRRLELEVPRGRDRRAADRTAPSRACGRGPTTSASADARSDLIFACSSRSRCSASSQRQLRLFVLDAGDDVALVDVQLRALDVVARLHQRGRVLFLGDSRLRARLLDLCVGLPQLRLLLLNRSLEREPSNCTRTSPGFTGAPLLASFTICSSPDCIGEARRST